MDSLLLDLYRHQAWADARHCGAILAHPDARADDAIRRRLLHILTVQRFFLWMAGGRSEPFAPPVLREGEDLERFRGLARGCHDEALGLVERLTDAQLDAPLQNPFSPAGAAAVSLRQSLVQCALHSQYHRGQNATRLREIGAEPPNTDLITWYWSGREAPRWEGA